MNSFSQSFKALAFVALLSTLPAHAMEAKKEIAPVVTKAAEKIKDEIKKECPFHRSICNAWTKVSGAVVAHKNKIVDGAKEMKARGWCNWTNQERAGVVVGGTLVAATAAYLVYKVYKSFTAPKVKVVVKSSRA